MIKGVFKKIGKGLAKTRRSLGRGFRNLTRRPKVDAALLDELEDLLVGADLGPQVAGGFVEALREKVKRREIADPSALQGQLAEMILRSVAIKGEPAAPALPWVILVVGVNGAGKTTTIAKLARQAVSEGRKTLLVAADTFRAAAIDQLSVWGDRVGAHVVSHQPGSDPASVAFDAISAAKARGVDLVLIDTAGRLQTSPNLMEELKKIKRVVGKAMGGAPHETLLVLDATTGQNALSQARLFNEALGVTGIALTKLDGTSKAGIVVPIVSELGIPVRYVGVGETPEDLLPFDAEAYVQGLFEGDDSDFEGGE